MFASFRIRTRRASFCLCFLIAGAIFFSDVQALKVRPLNLEQLTERAGRIFSGRCVEVRVTHDSDFGHPVTEVTFRVERTVKGQAGETLTVKLFGDRINPGRGIVDLPGFRRGEHVVLFLYPDSSLGLTSAVGLGQGKFRVFEDKQGRSVASNPYGNKTLFERLSSRALTALGVAPHRRSAGPEVEARALLDMAEALVRRDARSARPVPESADPSRGRP
jgi:hypothetical protein